MTIGRHEIELVPLLVVLDPAPDAVYDAGHRAYEHHCHDAVVAQLKEDRGNKTPRRRQLRFAADGLTVTADVRTEGPFTTITANLRPRVRGKVFLRTPGCKVQVNVQVDADGGRVGPILMDRAPWSLSCEAGDPILTMVNTEWVV